MLEGLLSPLADQQTAGAAGRLSLRRVIGSLVVREIVYRLLVVAQGDRLRHIAVLGGQGHRMTEAIRRLHAAFDRTVRMEDLASGVGMSTSTFYQRFKDVTEMTPLQFQKEVRLQEPRRLLLEGHLDAATAGYRVGSTTRPTSAGTTSSSSGAPRSRTSSGSGRPRGASSPT